MVGAGSSLATVIGGPLGVLVGQQAGWRAALRMISIAAAPAAGLCLALPAVRLPTAGHAIDYHRVGAAFQVGQLAFALNCAARQLQPSSGMSNRP
jgi:predicted MFS family arabinose efflux permease